jgi:hypothetical protein
MAVASRSAESKVGAAAITAQPLVAAADTPIVCIPPSSPDVSEVYDASGVDVNIDHLPARLSRRARQPSDKLGRPLATKGLP